jgi:hypothetical protein
MLLLEMPHCVVYPGEWGLPTIMAVLAAVDGAIVSRKDLMRAQVTPQIS